MRLIDANALADALFEKRKNYPQWVADTISAMPTIDVDVLLKEQDYRSWMIDMLHKYGRDDLISIMVLKGEENILADVLKELGKQKFFVDESGKITPLPVVVRCEDCVECYFAANRIQSEQSFACGKHGIDVTPDFCCADWERKEGR